MFYGANLLLFASSSYLGLPLKANFQREAQKSSSSFQVLPFSVVSQSVVKEISILPETQLWGLKAGAKATQTFWPTILAVPGSPRRRLSQPNWQESDRLGQRLSFMRQLLEETPCDLLMHPTFIHLRYSEIFFSFPHFMVHLFSRKMQRCVFNHWNDSSQNLNLKCNFLIICLIGESTLSVLLCVQIIIHDMMLRIDTL